MTGSFLGDVLVALVAVGCMWGLILRKAITKIGESEEGSRMAKEAAEGLLKKFFK